MARGRRTAEDGPVDDDESQDDEPQADGESKAQHAPTSVTNPAGTAFGGGNFGEEHDYGDGLLTVDVNSNLTLDGNRTLTAGEEGVELPNTPQVQDAIAAGHLTLRD